MEGVWKWYNKVDTKLREFNERWCFMKRKAYDKQFKIAAVKLILEEEVPVSVVAKELEIIKILCIAGLMNMKNMEKVHFLDEELHFIHINLKLKN